MSAEAASRAACCAAATSLGCAWYRARGCISLRFVKAKQWRQYLGAAAEFWIDGVRVQRERCRQAAHLPHDGHFMIVAAKRLRTVAEQLGNRAKVDLTGALAAFDTAQPHLADVRDSQEHLLGEQFTGTAMWFGGGDRGAELTHLRPDMGTEPLIESEALAEASERLYASICEAVGDLGPPTDHWIVRPRRPRPRKGSTPPRQ